MIKRTRLTNIQFCPSLKKQAEQLFDIASNHIGEHLFIQLECEESAHATYLSIQQDNLKIRYADSNHGAFLFDSKDQFISAYRIMYHHHNQAFPDKAYTLFSVNQLIEDKENKLTASNTFSGKVRSLLNGVKYPKNTSSSLQIISLSAGGIVGGTFGGFAGSLLGGILGSVIPLLGTATGALVGALVGGGVGMIFGGMSATNLNKSIHNKGLLGLTYKFLMFCNGTQNQTNQEELPFFITPQSDSSPMILKILGSDKSTSTENDPYGINFDPALSNNRKPFLDEMHFPTPSNDSLSEDNNFTFSISS